MGLELPRWFIETSVFRVYGKEKKRNEGNRMQFYIVDAIVGAKAMEVGCKFKSTRERNLGNDKK